MSTLVVDIANLAIQTNEILEQRSLILAKKKPIEAELSALAGRVRGSYSHRNRLSQEDYRQIVNRQTVLKRKLAEIEVEAAPLKTKLREIGLLSTLHYATRHEEIAKERTEAAATSIDPAAAMRKAIADLRGQWLAFAEDQTRVNSMRVMAAQFSRELTDLLGDVQP